MHSKHVIPAAALQTLSSISQRWCRVRAGVVRIYLSSFVITPHSASVGE